MIFWIIEAKDLCGLEFDDHVRAACVFHDSNAKILG